MPSFDGMKVVSTRMQCWGLVQTPFEDRRRKDPVRMLGGTPGLLSPVDSTAAPVLTETLPLHEERSRQSPVPLATGFSVQGLLSPDERTLAVIEPCRSTLCLIDLSQLEAPGHAHAPMHHSAPGADKTQDSPAAASAPKVQVHRFSACAPPDAMWAVRRGGTGSVAGTVQPHYEYIAAACWSPDSSRMAVVGKSGALYLLDRTGVLQVAYLPDKLPFPWSASGPTALAMPADDGLVLLTRDAQLYTVPLASAVASPAAFSKLRPADLRLYHGRTLAMAFDAHSTTLAILGEGMPGKPLPRLTLTLWNTLGLQVKFARQLGQAVPIKKQPSGPAGSAPAPEPHWSMAFSPGSEYLAIAAPPHGLSMVNGEGRPMELMLQGPGAAGPGGATRALASSAASVSWWSAQVVSLSDDGGGVALALVPDFANRLGPSPEHPRFTPGSRALCLTRGTGERGLLLLEPLLLPSARPAGAASVAPPPSSSAPPLAAGWKLSLLAQRTAEEMVEVHVAARRWEAALETANLYRLDCDSVYRARWASKPVSATNVAENLTPMSDRYWVAEECAMRLADDAASQRVLLEYCLNEAAVHCWAPTGEMLVGEDATPHVRWWRRMRLLMLRHLDRLDLLLALHKGVFDPAAFAAFRDTELLAAAQQYAAGGDCTALVLLLQYHPVALGPYLLQLLDALPETLDPRLYSQVLPRADCTVPVPPRPDARAADWVESYDTAFQLHEDGYTVLVSSTEHMLVAYSGGTVVSQYPFPEEWYCQRALQLDAAAGQLQHAVVLLEAALQRGVHGHAARLLNQARALRSLPSPSWDMSLARFAALPASEQLLLLLGSGTDSAVGSTDAELETALDTRAGPFCRGLPPDDRREAVRAVLLSQTAVRPAWCCTLVQLECSAAQAAGAMGQGLRLWGSVPELAEAVTAAVSACGRVDCWAELVGMVDAAQGLLEMSAQDPALTGLRHELHLLRSLAAAARVLSSRGAPLTLSALRSATPDTSLSTLTSILTQAVAASGPSTKSAVGPLKGVLSAVTGTGGSGGTGWSEQEWRALWGDLGVACRPPGGLPGLSPAQVLQGFVGALLRCGRVALAHQFLYPGSSPSSSAPALDPAPEPLPPSAVEALILSAAAEALKHPASAPDTSVSSTSLRQSGVALARSILALAPAPGPSTGGVGEAAAAQLRRLALAAKLQAMGVVSADTSEPPAAGADAGAGPLSAAQLVSEPDVASLLRRVLEAGRPLALHRRLPELQDWGRELSAAGPGAGAGQASEQAVALLAATEALAVGDVACARRLALRLVAAQYEPAWRVAASLGMEVSASSWRQGDSGGEEENEEGEDENGEQAQRRRERERCTLLAFAAARCDAEALPQLLEELAAGEKQQLDPDWWAAQTEVPAEVLLARAIRTPPATPAPRPPPSPTPSSSALPSALFLPSLPSLGDGPLALSALLSTPGADGAAAVRALSGPSCPHWQAQRALAVGVAGLSLQVLLPTAAPGGERRRLLATPPAVLLQQAQAKVQAAGPGCDPSAGPLLSDAEDLAALLRAAEDSRSVRAVVPTADPAAFRGGSTEQQRGVILQQADVAGRKAAAELSSQAGPSKAGAHLPPGTTPGAKLLAEALALGRSYQAASEWEVLGRYVVGLLAAAPPGALAPEVREEAMEKARQVLASAGKAGKAVGAAAQLACGVCIEAWPALPAASASHAAAALAVLALCVEVLAVGAAQQQAEAAAVAPAAAAAAALLPRLQKLRDLLDKAGGALRGLAIRVVLTPLLRPLLNQLDLAASATAAGEAPAPAPQPGALLSLAEPDAELASLVPEAQGAVYAYVTPANSAAASKLLKALQAIFALPRTSASGGASSSPLAKPLAALPASLPFLCLLLKLTSAPVSSPEAGSRLSLAAWSQARGCVTRVTAAQLRAWLTFFLLGGRQPLPSAAAGKLTALSPEAELHLAVLEDVLPSLAVSAASEQGASGPLADCLARLQRQYQRLRAWHALRAQTAALQRQGGPAAAAAAAAAGTAAAAVAVDDEGEAAARGTAASSSAVRLLHSGLRSIAEAGGSARALARVACEAATPGPIIAPSSANADAPASEPAADAGSAAATSGGAAALPGVPVRSAVTTAVCEALQSSLRQLSAEVVDGDDEAAAAEGAALARLHGTIACLGSDGDSSWEEEDEGPAAVPVPENAAAGGTEPSVLQLSALRDSAWGVLSEWVEGLPASAYSRPAVAMVLELQAGLCTQQVWHGWQPPHASDGAAGGGAADSLSSVAAPQQSRLLLGQTLVALAGCWPGLNVSAADVAGPEPAARLFERLLGQVGGEGAEQGGLRQLRLLASLLERTWLGGSAWGAEPEVVAEPEPEAGAEAAEGADGSSGGGTSASEGRAAWSACALHGCWEALGLALLHGRHVPDVLRMADRTRQAVADGGAAPLPPGGLAALACSAGDAGLCGGLAAVALALLAPGVSSDAAVQPWYKRYRRTLLSGALVHVSPAAVAAAAGPATTAAACCVAAAVAAEPACSGRTAAALCGSQATWPALCAALTALPPHPGVASATPTMASAPPSASAACELSGALLPCLAARLVLQGQAPGAAVLVAERMALHPGLRSLEGSLQLTDRFLEDVVLCKWQPKATHEAAVHREPRGSDAAGGEQPAWQLAEQVAWAVPHTMLAAARQLTGNCKDALQSLRSDMRAGG